MSRIFGCQDPVICELCLQGMKDRADEWLESKIEAYQDWLGQIPGSIRTVLALFDDFKFNACLDDAYEYDPEAACGLFEEWKPRNPDLRIEFALLDVVAIVLERERVRTARYWPLEESKEEREAWLRRNQELAGEMERGLATLWQLHQDKEEERRLRGHESNGSAPAWLRPPW